MNEIVPTLVDVLGDGHRTQTSASAPLLAAIVHENSGGRSLAL